MKRTSILLTIGFLIFPAADMASGVQWEHQDSGVATSLRGLSAVNESCCWASGAKGTVIRTIDGGKSWRAVGPLNIETADFRDIKAWDESTAVIMSAGDGPWFTNIPSRSHFSTECASTRPENTDG
jgi:photosystem II stability/assembly factor-like uncharacterized protein